MRMRNFLEINERLSQNVELISQNNGVLSQNNDLVSQIMT